MGRTTAPDEAHAPVRCPSSEGETSTMQRFYTYSHTPNGPVTPDLFDWMTQADMEEFAEDADTQIVEVLETANSRTYQMADGSVHSYTWQDVDDFPRCAKCGREAEGFMLTDEAWQETKMYGWVCWRCVEETLGRRLTPADFQTDLPINDSSVRNHEPELRERINGTR